MITDSPRDLEKKVEYLKEEIEYLKEEIEYLKEEAEEARDEWRNSLLEIDADVTNLALALIDAFTLDFHHDPRYCVEHRSCLIIRKLDEDSLPNLESAI